MTQKHTDNDCVCVKCYTLHCDSRSAQTRICPHGGAFDQWGKKVDAKNGTQTRDDNISLYSLADR